MVSENFEIVIAFAAMVVGIGLIWLARSQPD